MDSDPRDETVEDGARPRAVLFSDPNCPFCYATEERLHALGLTGVPR